MRSRFVLLVALLLATACGSSEPRQPRPPKHRTWDDDGPDPTSYPERTTREPRDPAASDLDGLLPKSPDPKRPNVKVELTVVDVLSWDEVRIRSGVRGSVVKGVVSLTGWLAGGKSKGGSRSHVTQFIVVGAGHEGSIELSDPAVRDLIGPYAALRVAILETTEKGEIDVNVAPLVSPTEDGQLTLATRVRVATGEALVLGGHRSQDEGDAGSKKRDQLVILVATILR